MIWLIHTVVKGLIQKSVEEEKNMTYGLIDIDAGTLVGQLFVTEGLAFQWLRQHKLETGDQDTYRIVSLKGQVTSISPQLLEALA
jgi:phage baseplate assembly protein gpV